MVMMRQLEDGKMSDALSAAAAIAPEMVKLRRNLHRHAELAFEEEETAQILISELQGLGLPYDYQGIGSPVVARLDVGTSACVWRIGSHAETDDSTRHISVATPLIHDDQNPVRLER
jgi:hypothetical protein